MAFFDFFKKKNKDAEYENLSEENQALDEELKDEEVSDISEDNTEENSDEDKQEISTEENSEDIPQYENTDRIEDILPEDETSSDDEDVAQATEEAAKEAAGEESEPVETASHAEEAPKKKAGFFSMIKAGLQKTRDNILSSVERVLGGFTEIDDDLYDELEEALIMADIGVDTSLEIIERTRKTVKDEKIKDVSEVKSVIVRVISDMLSEDDEPLELPHPSTILVIGVNGVGKTTTIGKLTNFFKSEGKSVMLAAADTFRAAAIDQLAIWGERNDVKVIKHSENSDPAAVVFDAVAAARNRDTDILICDTAGRLHNKKNLMEELKKISRVITRENENTHKEVFLVLDATTGQNALQQAKLFKEAADITGIVLTKLDGTAKGGIVIAIKNELKIPVRFIGVGEGIDDLRPFDATEFARALFEE